jgi:hypothetical protein
MTERNPPEPDEDFAIKLLSLAHMVRKEIEKPRETDQLNDRRPRFELKSGIRADPVVAELITRMEASEPKLHVCVKLPEKPQKSP